MISISVQEKDFDVGEEYRQLQSDNTCIGGVAIFTGQVRDLVDNPLKFMRLEHYPGMTEKSLQQTAEQATKRWPVIDICIIHRIGDLVPGEQIVFVGVSSAHPTDCGKALSVRYKPANWLKLYCCIAPSVCAFVLD